MYLHVKIINIHKNYIKGAQKDLKSCYIPLDLTNAPAFIFSGGKAD